MILKIALVSSPQEGGGFVVTSPVLPEFVTEGDTLEEALAGIGDALSAVLEIYEDLGWPFPKNVRVEDPGSPVWFETLVVTA